MVVRLDTHEALENFSDMITRVHESGETVVIERADKPIAVAGTLAGAFPELAYLSDEDMDWAKQQWQRGLDRCVDHP